VRPTCPWSCAQVNVPCIRAGGCTERRYCNPSTLIGWRQPLHATREPTRVTTRTPAVGCNPGWVDPLAQPLQVPVMLVSQYGRPPQSLPATGLTLPAAMPASREPLPARHGKCGVTAGTARQSPNPNYFAGTAGNFTSRQRAACRHASLPAPLPNSVVLDHATPALSAAHSSFGAY
jgi:hypothetical protein